MRVTEPARGGHVAPFEEPELYAEELLSIGPQRYYVRGMLSAGLK